MSSPTINPTHTRSWRDIPQQVSSRAMSRGGRRRVLAAGWRTGTAAVVVAGVIWAGWEVAAALRKNPAMMPQAAKAVPVKNFSLKTNADGVLDANWLKRTLALPKGVSLMELNLEQLQARLLADGQVSVASVALNFPDTLEVRIAERSPVARLRAQLAPDDERTLLVARDGVVYEGTGYAAAQLESMPWLAGAKLSRAGGRFAPIDGMNRVAELLGSARLNNEALLATWQVISLERFASDREIEVRTKPGTVVVFGADGDFAVQLARLDYQWDVLAKLPAPPTRIDLSLGKNEVPVAFDVHASAAKSGGPVATKSAPNAAPTLFVLPHSPAQTKREL
jgi:cell division protein FtsQ